MANTPFKWDTTPSSWAELGKRVSYEIHRLAAEKQTQHGQAEVNLRDLANVLDTAWRELTPLDVVDHWVATRAADVPEVTDR